MERERRSRDYWREQLSEYWDGGLTIQEYCELKDLPYENVRRWIGILKKYAPNELHLVLRLQACYVLQ